MSFKIPAGIMAQHIIALGKTRSGKSSKLRVLVEGLLDDAKPVCIIDPKGDWWGLKSSADSKRAGYPIVIFGGEHADVPINERSGTHVAELIATGNRSCLIDLGGWTVGERTRFFIEFASSLFKHARGARHLVIDEVHNFAPQGKIMNPDAGKMLHWANRLASEGAGKGITIIAASQRPQKVAKDFVTSCETLIANKVIHKLDRNAIKDWIDGCADPDKGKEVIASLAQLKKPQAWVWCPEIDYGPVLIDWPMFKTYDSFKPQQAAQGKLKGWAGVDLDEVKSKLEAVVQEAAANDPAELKKRIAALERELKAKPAAAPAAADPKAIVRAEVAARAKGVEEGARAMVQQYGHIHQAITEWYKKWPGFPKVPMPKAAAVEIRGASFTVHPQGQKAPETMAAIREVVAAAAKLPSRMLQGNGSTDPAITGGKRKMLAALAQYPEGMDYGKLGILTGLSSKSGTWSTYIGALRSAGYAEGSADRMRITDAGLDALGHFDPLPSGPDLIEYWRGRMGAGGKRKILDALIDVYPNSMTYAEVAERTGLSSESGTWSTYLGQLRSLGLVTGRGDLKAGEVFFQ
jgi:uncharacterized protein